MNNPFHWKTAASLLSVAGLAFASSASATLVVAVTNQTGNLPFTPNWTLAANSLIAGLVPSSASGDFSLEAPGRNVASLTAGGSLSLALTSANSGTTTSTNYVTCGNGAGAGSSVTYTLPASTNGYSVTNITVYSGWADNGRDAQSYNVSYSTAANPAFFTLITSVAYNPTVAVGTATANRVTLSDSAGLPLAANVSALKFDFTAVENGYEGYGAITVQGTPTTNVDVAPLLITTQNQSSDTAFTPTWIIEQDSLIQGQSPAVVGTGDFANEGGVTGTQALTDGTFGVVDDRVSYATCGSMGGQSVTYALSSATITNLVVYSGWMNENRDGQFYKISYSTTANPTSFILLTTLFYNPVVSGISANRVSISTSSGAPLATNVAFLMFDFSTQDSGTDYGYSGYAEIVVEGTGTPTVALPPTMNTSVPVSAANNTDAVLVFNEIMYHPATNEAGMEWFEFYNQMAVDIDISGWRVGGDTDYTFPADTRVAGRSYIVVARDPEQLRAATGLSSNVFGPFGSPLDNQGGTLELHNNTGRLMDSLTFGTEGNWPVTPDGAGPSLSKIDRDWAAGAAANWKASRQNGGTPGAVNFVSPAPPVTVAFNELSGTTNAMFWVELVNYGSNVVSLGNCIFHHDGVTNTDYLFPPDVTLPPGAFLVLSNATVQFKSPSSGEKLFLFAPNETEVYDGLVLKKGPRARSADGTGAWLAPSSLTPGASNRFAFHCEVVINEIMFDHKAFPAASSNSLPQSNPEEWIELYNRSANSVDLTGWSLSGGLSYQFSANKIIAPGGYLVVARDAGILRESYPAVDIVGNYSGHLASDDLISLNDPLGNPANQVHYYSGGRWSEIPGGGGSSLELRDPNADNSKAEAWAPSNESATSTWQTNTYRMVAKASVTYAPDDQWREFVIGLLSDGECWVDDLSVVQSPATSPVQLINNGNFEAGQTGWRLLGNHQRSVVETDPDVPGNHVLHIVASGPQEHMHNHIETTLTGGRRVTNGLLYEISYRARWITQNHLLNTRLYFNRVAHTATLQVPQLNGTPGAVNSRYTTNIGPTFAQFQHQPVVPQPNQPITIFVRAQDPQGVSACAVCWSVNGGLWQNAPMGLTNGAYAGTIPGLQANSLVQFYVRATDSLGAVSTYPAKGTNSGAFFRVNEGLANITLTHNLRILMSPANIALQFATTNLMSNENMPCTVIYDERQAYYDMAVRLKSSERGRVEAARIGFHLEFSPEELFRGVHPVMLADRSTGGSRPGQEEMLLKHMVVHAGVAEVNSDLCQILAPQSAENGLSILSPRYEDNFVGGSFTNGGNGTLYELELTYYPTTANAAGYKLPSPDNVQGVDISDLGSDKEAYRYNFIIKNHRNVDDYTSLINFAQTWSLTGAALEAQTPLTMDVDEWLSAYAMVSLCGVSDMYTFGNNHNFMTYVRPGDGKLLYFPWDMDFSFAQSATAPLVGDQNLGKIVNLPGNLRRFYAHVQEDISTTFNVSYMTAWVNHYGSISGQNYSDDLNYISQRGAFALSSINSAGGNAAFAINGTNFSNISSNLIALSGTAPVQLANLLVNGKSYPVTWTSLSTWTVQVPVSSVTNVLNVQGSDLHGSLVTNITRTVIYSGVVPDPSKTIMFNEIMYHPAVTNAEYVELFNASTNFNFDLSGWRINGLGYTFPTGSVLSPRGFLVLAKDPVAFGAAYGSTLPIFDQFTGSLDPSGETLSLFMPDPAQTNAEVVVDRVRYDAVAPWPVITNGASLQLIDPTQDNSRAANWGYLTTNAGTQMQWARASATGIPLTSAVSRPLYIYLQSAGDIYIDDVSVVAGSVAESGVNVVTNSGFETALTPWTIGSDGNNSASVISANVAHTGSHSLHLIASAGGSTQNSSVWEDFSSRLTVGATYTLSFWYLQSTNGGPLTFRFSGSGIAITTNPVPTIAPNLSPSTPDASNSIAATLPSFPALWINELQAQNVTGPTNSAGAHASWAELYNSGPNSLSLGGFYLANTYTNLTQWAFPTNATVPANGFLFIWCDGLTNQTTTNAPHASFSLPSGTGNLVLSRLLSTNVPQILDYLSYTNLPQSWSYGDYPDGQPFYRQQMFAATPGTTNSAKSSPLSISINEWMADNGHTLTNPASKNPDDWFELYNYGTNTVDLGGYYLTGTLTNKTKFQIPNTHQYLVPPKGFFLVWADNLNASNSTVRPELHVNFRLSKGGEAIGLFAPDGTTIDALTFNAQNTDVSQGRFPDGAADLFFMPSPTPQTNNLIPNTAPVLLAISDRFVYIGQTVQVTASATDAESFYQTLTFSLSNAPTGASINAQNGTFQWSTSNSVSPATNWVTVRVMDDGIPPLSTTKTFTIVISSLPKFNAVSAMPDGRVQITFDTLAGQSYRLEFKENLTDAAWIVQGEPVLGLGAPLTVYDTIKGPNLRFYRLRAVSQP